MKSLERAQAPHAARLLRGPATWEVIAEPLNGKPKYVASTTLTEPLEWQNSTLVEGDVAAAVRALKQDGAGDLHVISSTELVRTLIEHDLVDELRLMIDPVVLGGGKRIFRDDGCPGSSGSSTVSSRARARSLRHMRRRSDGACGWPSGFSAGRSN